MQQRLMSYEIATRAHENYFNSSGVQKESALNLLDFFTVVEEYNSILRYPIEEAEKDDRSIVETILRTEDSDDAS